MEQIDIKEYFKQEVEKLRLATSDPDIEPPSLTIVDATDGDIGNQIYIRKKIEDFEALNWPVKLVKPADNDNSLWHLLENIDTSSVIVQMPVAKRFNFNINDIPNYLDCDGLTKDALVYPATVRGILDYLNTCGFSYEGKSAVVLGRSEIVGKPMAQALLDRNMTVSVCHSKTPKVIKQYLLHSADLVVSAIGKPHIINRNDCRYAIVIDVGISRDPETNKVTGDFLEYPPDAETMNVWSTPVPGGVGLLTRLGLMKNCLDLQRM